MHSSTGLKSYLLCNWFCNYTPGIYEVYRGYFCEDVCVCVCVCVNFFSVKDFSGTARHRMMKFGTNIGYGKLYCVRKNQPSPAYQPLYLSIFLSL